MNVSDIDLAALSQALDDHEPDREHYLDLRDGSLWTFVFSDSTDETRSRRDEVLEGLGTVHLQIRSRSSQEAYEEIEDFIESVTDAKTQDSLFRALERKGAFRNFREAILQLPEERQRWSAHRKERSSRRLRAFLQEHGLEAPESPSEVAT